MARKSNKTSHVLNLITNGAPAEPEPKETETPGPGASGAGTAGAEASGGGSAAAQAGAAPASGTGGSSQNAGKGQEPAAQSGQTGDRKVIVVDASENDKIADAIRERLEEQVEREAGNTDTPAQKEAPTVPIENGVLDADALMDAVDSMMPEAMDMMTKAEEKAEAAEAAKAARMAEAAATDAIGEAAGAATEKKVKGPHYHMVNVMEEVVNRYDLSGQMAKYGVCNCSRCHADVQALTLTHLPSKYVVVDGNPIAPIIGYYESKYRSRLLTEVMKACILVKDKPRHNRNNVTPEMLE